jgi:tetratricopeptide (TPR) repeat protein
MRRLPRLIKLSVLLSGITLSAGSATSARPHAQMRTSLARAPEQLRKQIKSEAESRIQSQPQGSETDELLQSAYALYRQGKLDEALSNLNKAAALSPKDFRPLALTGYVYSAQRKMKSASEAFAAAIRVEPQRKELYMAKAEADYLRNAHEEALVACRKATEVDPNYADAYVMIGDLLAFDKKRRDEAVAALQAAMKINPALPKPYEILGSILQSEKDEAGAEKVFRQGMAADPKHMGGRFPLGRLLVKQGRLAEARELWEGRTSDEDRTYPQFIELLKRAQNLKLATDALAKNPRSPDALIDRDTQ